MPLEWPANDFVIWRVRVWEEGVLKGEPDGRILSPPKDHIRAVVTGVIEQSIEKMASRWVRKD